MIIRVISYYKFTSFKTVEIKHVEEQMETYWSKYNGFLQAQQPFLLILGPLCPRMPVENQEARTLEVLNLPPNVDQELLALYFENKRRSGGGPLVSVEKRGDRAIVVFEETEGECIMFRPQL